MTLVLTRGAKDASVKPFVLRMNFSASTGANLAVVSEAVPGTTWTFAVAVTVGANVVNERLRVDGIQASASFAANVAVLRLFVLGVSFSASLGANVEVASVAVLGVTVVSSTSRN
jgi:hypothetical protein